MKKKLNIGVVGYGFMGRTHSNAFGKVGNFFDLPYQPVLKTICARNPERAKTFAAAIGGRPFGETEENPRVRTHKKLGITAVS